MQEQHSADSALAPATQFKMVEMATVGSVETALRRRSLAGPIGACGCAVVPRLSSRPA